MSDPEEVGDGWGDELDDLPEVPAPTEQNAELEQLRERLQESEELRAKEREELQSRLQEVMQKAKDRIMEMQSRMTEMQETLQERDSQLDRLQSVGLPAAEVCELGSEAQVSAELALREELEQCREKLARLREESESRLAAAADHDRMQEELAQCRKELEEQRKESAARLADAADQDRLQEELAQCRKELEEQRQESAARLADAAGQDQLSDELEKLREESEKRSAEAEEHAKAREELLQCGSELERLREELATRQEELERRTEELQDCRTELAKLQTAERPAEEDVPPRPRESDELAECRAELAQLHEESESRLSDVVRKSKEHLLSLQTRLEAAVSENAELLEKQKEAEEVQQQQQEKLAKMRQLVAKANDRISESESREKALSESLSKAQSQRLSLQEQIGSLEKNFSMPPSREEIEQRGGILLAVETDSDDVWCLVSTGLCPDESATAVEEVPSIQKRVRWWLLSQLDVAERPVPMQRRWKGEVSALRAQMQRFKKRAEDLQEEYDAYKDKANAALQNSALQSQELQLKERQAEHQGEQLQGMALEMQRMQADKARMSDEVHDMRRQLREADARRADLERSLERKVRESDERGKAEVQSCRTSLEGKMDELERGWRERERALRQELDLRRAQKEALDEEVASLRSLLESHAAATKAAETAAAEAAAAAAAAAAKERAEAEKAPSPVAELPASLLPPSDMPVAEPQPQVARSDSTATAAPAQAESALPPQAYSLHTSVAWQDLVSLRSQVRQLEAQMKEEQERHMVSLQESDRARKQLQNYIDEHRLEQTVGQHQHMEYIRNVFRKFVEMLPANSAETEQLVQVLMTFFQFSSEDAAAIQAKRGAARKQGLWRLF